jgi:hypothetical protein
MVHSCGSWEDKMKSSMTDHNLIMLNCMSREVDFEKVCKMTGGKISIVVWRSLNLNERWTWPDAASYYRYMMRAFTEPTPLEMVVNEEDLQEYLRVQTEEKGGKSGLFRFCFQF